MKIINKASDLIRCSTIYDLNTALDKKDLVSVVQVIEKIKDFDTIKNIESSYVVHTLSKILHLGYYNECSRIIERSAEHGLDLVNLKNEKGENYFESFIDLALNISSYDKLKKHIVIMLKYRDYMPHGETDISIITSIIIRDNSISTDHNVAKTYDIIKLINNSNKSRKITDTDIQILSNYGSIELLYYISKDNLIGFEHFSASFNYGAAIIPMLISKKFAYNILTDVDLTFNIDLLEEYIIDTKELPVGLAVKIFKEMLISVRKEYNEIINAPEMSEEHIYYVNLKIKNISNVYSDFKQEHPEYDIDVTNELPTDINNKS